MKCLILAAGAALVAMPAAAQAWYDPPAWAHNGYVEVEGGAAFQGRMESRIAASGLGAANQSAAQDQNFFGGALAGYRLADGVSVEAEGVYNRNHEGFSPNNPVFGIGGAVRTYGGLGNLRLSLPNAPSYRGFKLTPYVAAGIGYGDVQFTGRNGAFVYRDTADGLLWQGKAGVEIQLQRHVALDLGYRYLQSPDYQPGRGAFNSPNYTVLARSHVQAATAGLKFYF